MILTKHIQLSRLLLVTTACFSVFGASFSAHAAFDPNYGADSSVAVPDSQVLYPQKARLAPTASQGYISPLAPVQMPERPLYPSRVASVAPSSPADLQPAGGAHYEPAQAPVAAAPIAASAPLLAPLAATAKPFIAPAPVLAQATTVASPVATMTPEITVESAAATVAAKEAAPAPTAPITPAVAVAAQPVATPPAAPQATVAAPAAAFIAPAPVLANAQPAAAPAPAAKVAPVTVAAAQPQAEPNPDALSKQTKTILAHIPSQLDTAAKSKSQKIAMERTSPEVKEAFAKDKDNKVESYNANGLSIKVSRPGLDTGFELNRAYTMLMGGQTQDAVDVYKNILSSESSNQDALFGLAATYHRLGELEKARPLYGALLKLNPNHREALNNFLVLVSDESPQEALAELERLEQRNPDFSPIPAQEAILMDKLGYAAGAKSKMLRAIELAPENLTYKYNLAIMLDRQGNYADAGALYRLLIDAALKGEKIPAALETLQKRLNFITTAAVTTPQGV